MGDKAAAYTALLQALLPSGAAWPRDDGAVLTQVLGAMADGMARIDDRAVDLVNEADPRSTMEMIGGWERVAGLPDACSAGINTTLQERRAALVARLTATGGQSVGYFAALIAILGYSATIEQFRPAICGIARCGRRLDGPASVRHTWRVTVHGPRATRARTGQSQAGDKLVKITRAEDLACMLHRLKPAHTTLILAYEGA